MMVKSILIIINHVVKKLLVYNHNNKILLKHNLLFPMNNQIHRTNKIPNLLVHLFHISKI